MRNLLGFIVIIGLAALCFYGALALASVICGYIAKQYDKKHPDKPKCRGCYMGVRKAGYNMSAGEAKTNFLFFTLLTIFALLFFFIEGYILELLGIQFS